ncbi:hypothetical protein JR316_0004999 [Psilocybe cubensis]|uniref:Uncharacterized protein n=2 Tax=Psilocybe cubensis TaxID=181762 RepID=A0A8H7XZ43_PSICU|nr:hypothetical protein JR316_0004999 [Psilocybe cubensis]KAH9482899.1 hypothetical protein JR316_0004999 [Psilocybe cubensis]
MDFAVPDDAAARNRFETFKLGKGLPSAKHGHSRSHSRNISFSFPKSASVNDISAFSFPAAPSPTLPSSPSHSALTNTVPNPIPPAKRNSHHRRRSSVSTRHESAEMMGVALPDLPVSTSDDNINLGEKDSIRRRALWALEGKPDVAFNKVEIPDISTPDIEKMMFDFSTKSSSYGNASKRDSFKLLGPSSSAKDQLGTLLEEEEEEEEVNPLPSPAPSVQEELPPPNTPITPLTPSLSITKPTPAKPRPSNLNLRPLSLTPDSVVASLPSPSPTPSPRQGLRTLALTPSSSTDDNAADVKQSRRNSLVVSPTPSSKRPVLNLSLENMDKSLATTEEEPKPSRRSSISYKKSHNSVTMNIAGLPTPEMTPTFGRRYSTTESLSSVSNDDEVFPNPPTQTRPLSASEQHFLFKSHNALLARITDLERALSMRRRESGGYSNGGSSRPASVASNFSSSSAGTSGVNGSQAGEPSDEMLNLIADLKSERDELKRDVDGWRTRVGDMENQMSVLTKRIEHERRDAWVARSRVGLLEVEKGVLAKKVEALDELLAIHDKEKGDLENQVGSLLKENSDSKQRITELEAQVESLRLELANERSKNVKESDPLVTPTPRSFDSFKRPGMGLPNKKHGLGFASVDSESSVTDVEQDSSDDCIPVSKFPLKSVQEESDEVDEDGVAGYDDEDDEDNGLAGYEDEEDTDMSLQSSSSFDSEEDLPRSIAHLHNSGLPSSPTTPRPQVFTPPRSNHARRATLSKTWTFPFGCQPQTPPKVEEDETVDRFFGCLDDGESDTTGSVPSSPSAYSYEKSKGLFASGFKFASADDNASFFLPDGVGTLADSQDGSDKEDKALSVVAEEDEEETTSETEATGMDSIDGEDLFGEEIGGIRITFTPPQEEPVVEERKQIQLVSPIKRTSPPPILPALNFGIEEDDEDEEEQDDIRRVIPFNFGRPSREERQASPPPPVTVSAPVISAPLPPLARSASPSMIPRPASPSSSSSLPRLVTSRPVVATSVPSSVPESTPLKASPSRVVSASSTSYVTPPNKRGGVTPSFIPQPVSSPSPLRTTSASGPSTVTKSRAVPTSTFIRQPTKKPLLPTPSSCKSPNNNTGNSNGSTMIPQIPSIPVNTGIFRRSSNEPAALPATDFFDVSNNNNHSSAQMKSVDLSHESTFTSPSPRPSATATTTTTRIPRSSISSSSNASSSISSIVSSPLSARLSFQTITNFMPLSWTSTLTSASANPPAPLSDVDDDVTIVPAAPAVRRRSGKFVSRELQLRKLQTRMDVEGVLAMRMAVQFQCKKCDGNAVFI